MPTPNKTQISANSNLVESNATTTAQTPPPVSGFTHKISDQETVSFTPTKTIGYGIAYNEQGKNDMERLGLTKFQVADVNSYLKNLAKDGIPEIEKTKLTQEYIKSLQKNNTDYATYGLSSGSKRESVPTDPTKDKGSIEANVDLNNNGIPDSEETAGMKDTTTPSKVKLTVTDPVTGKPVVDES